MVAGGCRHPEDNCEVHLLEDQPTRDPVVVLCGLEGLVTLVYKFLILIVCRTCG